MDSNRCGQFSIEVEEILVVGAPVVLRVPIRRCRLAERMIQLLSTTERGQKVAEKIKLASAQGAGKRDTEAAAEEILRAAFGPDLEAIHPHECTQQRCLESCTPSFKMLLRQFGFFAEAEREQSAGCRDPLSEASESQLL